MLHSDVERIVVQSINAHSHGDTISKSELEEILIDVLTKFGKSSSLSKTVEDKISREQKLRRNLQGLR